MTLFHQPLQYWQAGGPLLIPVAVVCFALWAYYFRTRRQFADALHLPQSFDSHLLTGISSSPLDTVRQDLTALPGAVPRAVSEALAAIRGGRSAAAAFDDAQTWHMRQLKRDLLVLAALTAVAPLLGLLGTVTGMISTFQAVADSTGETTGRVASGISQALITTQFGLVVAIPGFFALARLQRTAEHVQVLFLQTRTHLMLALEQRRSGSPPLSTHPVDPVDPVQKRSLA